MDYTTEQAYQDGESSGYADWIGMLSDIEEVPPEALSGPSAFTAWLEAFIAKTRVEDR